MGVFQRGGLTSHSFCGQIYHSEVKGGPPTKEGELQLKQASLLLRFLFFSFKIKKKTTKGCR